MKILILLAILLSAPPVTATTAALDEATGEGTHVVIGMLEELDIPKLSGKIKTDLGQTVSFRMVKPDLFKGLSVGERIAVRLNDQGQVIRVMDTTVPELPSPEK